MNKTELTRPYLGAFGGADWQSLNTGPHSCTTPRQSTITVQLQFLELHNIIIGILNTS